MRLQPLTLVWIGVSPLIAQEPSKQAKIEEILKLTNIQQVHDQLVQRVTNQFTPIPSTGSDPDAKAAAEALQKRLLGLVWDAMKWEKLKPEYIKWYDETFTAAEITDILVFYTSPAGRALREKTPLLPVRLAEISKRILAQLQPEMERISKEAFDKSTARPKGYTVVPNK